MSDYDVLAFGAMIADRGRIDPYHAALRHAVRPGMTVLDIGTGTGIFALLACTLGAARVYAIDLEPAVSLAPELARANGFQERIVFIRGDSTAIELPELADVVVSDLRGVLPPFAGGIGAVMDARDRLMKPGGVLIPQHDTLIAAVVEAPDRWNEQMGPWRDDRLGLDLTPGLRIASQQWGKMALAPRQLVTAPAPWARIEYPAVQTPHVRGTVVLAAERDADGHGIAAWFDTELAPGIGFSTGPGGPDMVYRRAFFPWPHPVRIARGDTVTAAFRAVFGGGDYLWRWDSVIVRPDGSERARFSQSTLGASVLDIEDLRWRRSDHRPVPGERSAATRLVLDAMEARQSLQEIARELAARFPARFATWERALSYAAAVAHDAASPL